MARFAINCVCSAVFGFDFAVESQNLASICVLLLISHQCARARSPHTSVIDSSKNKFKSKSKERIICIFNYIVLARHKRTLMVELKRPFEWNEWIRKFHLSPSLWELCAHTILVHTSTRREEKKKIQKYEREMVKHDRIIVIAVEMFTIDLCFICSVSVVARNHRNAVLWNWAKRSINTLRKR